MDNKLYIKSDNIDYWVCITSSDPRSLDVALWGRDDMKISDITIISFMIQINDKWYRMSLNYENLYLLLERWEKCIKAVTPVSTMFVNYRTPIHLTYFPLNEIKWYLSIYEDSFPVTVDKTAIEKDNSKIISWEIDLYRTMSSVFRPILNKLLISQRDEYMYFFDAIKENLQLSSYETLNYLESLSSESLDEILQDFPIYNCYLYWWEPKKVILAVKKRFKQVKWYTYDSYMKLLIKKNWFYEYMNWNLLWIFPTELFRYINHKEVKKDLNNPYFSLLEMKNWVIRWSFSFNNDDELPIFLSCRNDLEIIRWWLESLIPNAQSPKNFDNRWSEKVLKFWWEFKRPEITVKLRHDWNNKTSTSKRKYIYSYDSIVVEYFFLGETTEKYFSKHLMTTTGIIRFFYKTIMEFLTSEYFIDSYKLQKIKYYGEDVSYDSIIKKFESIIIEDYLWEEMESYIKYLKKRRESIKYKIEKK